MTGERSYTTKIWRQPSSIGFSSADALSTSMDPPGEPVISTRKRPCQKIQNGSEFPELVAQNSRNPQSAPRRHCPELRVPFHSASDDCRLMIVEPYDFRLPFQLTAETGAIRESNCVS